MKTFCAFFFFLLISIPMIAQDLLHMITGEAIPVKKVEYREKDQSVVYVDPTTGYTFDTKLWSVEKLVMEDGTDISYEEYDKTFDINNHKQGNVYVTSTPPTNTELTLIAESTQEFMNLTEDGAFDEIRKLAYHQGGNVLFVQVDRNGNSGRFNVNYKIYSTLQFDPTLFDSYKGTFAIEGFNDGIKLDDWADPLYTVLGTNEKLIFKGNGVYEARSSKRVYETNLSFDGDNLTIDYVRIKKNGKRSENSVSLRIVGNDQNHILALRNESGYLMSLE